VSRETLRKWMCEAGLWRVRPQQTQAVHVWRERRACFGELVIQDSSPYRWLEDRGPVCHLIALIDDATSRIWGRFAEHDTTAENFRALEGWLRRWGRPLAVYTDRDSIFQPAGPRRIEDELQGTPARTQFGRALAEPGIEWIPADSPQAQGLRFTLHLLRALRNDRVHGDPLREFHALGFPRWIGTRVLV